MKTTWTHYVMLNSSNYVIACFDESSVPTSMDLDRICIRENDSQHAYLINPGDANTLVDPNGLFRYHYINGEIIKRSDEELQAEYQSILNSSPPSPQDQLRADVDYLSVMTGIDL